MARLSRLNDVLNAVAVVADMEPYAVGERVLAGEYLVATGANDLHLYERRYPAFWLFSLHRKEQGHFCARMPVDFSSEVTAFVASGKKSDVVVLPPGAEARKQCQLSA